jgi:hypothetical protein
MNSLFHDTLFQFIPDGKPAAFWVITAYNPRGKAADPGDNISADARLRGDLEDLGIKPFRVIGTSRDESHAEPGWGFPCDAAAAIEIGRRYRQLAIFHFTDGRIDLVDCKSGASQALDHPSARIRDPRDVRHFEIFIGSPGGSGKMGPMEYTGVCTRTGALFPGFTMQRTEGCFRSKFEDALLIHIGTREPHKVIALAHKLRCFLNQDGVGISHNGIYQRITDWTDNALILEAFGFTAYASDPS